MPEAKDVSDLVGQSLQDSHTEAPVSAAARQLVQEQTHRNLLPSAGRQGLLTGPSPARVSCPPLCAPPPADTMGHSLAGPGLGGCRYPLDASSTPPQL